MQNCWNLGGGGRQPFSHALLCPANFLECSNFTWGSFFFCARAGQNLKLAREAAVTLRHWEKQEMTQMYEPRRRVLFLFTLFSSVSAMQLGLLLTPHVPRVRSPQTNVGRQRPIFFFFSRTRHGAESVARLPPISARHRVEKRKRRPVRRPGNFIGLFLPPKVSYICDRFHMRGIFKCL